MGLKTVENRTWNCRYRGPVLIHASAGKPYPSDWADIFPKRDLEALASGWTRLKTTGTELPAIADLPRGAIIALANVTDCTTEDDDRLLRNPFAEGPFCIMLDGAEQIPAWHTKGKLGFWQAPDSFWDWCAAGCSGLKRHPAML